MLYYTSILLDIRFIIMIINSFNAAKLRKNNHNDFTRCFKNFIKFILLHILYWRLRHLPQS